MPLFRPTARRYKECRGLRDRDAEIIFHLFLSEPDFTANRNLRVCRKYIRICKKETYGLLYGVRGLSYVTAKREITEEHPLYP